MNFLLKFNANHYPRAQTFPAVAYLESGVRNKSLKPGVSRTSRSNSYARRKLYSKKKEVAKAASAKITTKVKPIGGDKNGKTRTVSLINTPKYYPAEDVKIRKVSRKTVGKTCLKSTITPGSVLILLSGRFAGKRVVFLKQLESGLLLVTGPFKINGVPLKRVDQAYVIGTSAKVDVSSVKLEKFTDAYFAKNQDKKAKATEKELFGNGEKKPMAEGRVKDQKETDAAILLAVKKTPALKSYLNASFALGKGEYPHLMKF